MNGLWHFLFGAVSVLMLSALGQQAAACACCAERGERFEQRFEMPQYLLEEFGALTVSSAAQVFITACGEECVKGVDVSEVEASRLELSQRGRWLALTFFEERGAQKGVLTFKLPEDYEVFGVDLAPLSQANSVALYKEMRFRGKLMGNGAFDFPAGPQTAELVLSGYGNMCHSLADMEIWNLTVTSEKTDFRLFGGLKEHD